MDTIKNILGHREFFNKAAIKESIKRSVNYCGEKVRSVAIIRLFETAVQRTWLVASKKRIYIILDDVRAKDTSVNSFRRLESPCFGIEIEADYKLFAGRIHPPGGTKTWLYSKHLFWREEDLVNALSRLEKI